MMDSEHSAYAHQLLAIISDENISKVFLVGIVTVPWLRSLGPCLAVILKAITARELGLYLGAFRPLTSHSITE